MDNKNPIVCLNCFHRSRGIINPCNKCGSRKLAHVAFLIQQMDEAWELFLKGAFSLSSELPLLFVLPVRYF
jgi:primosomal protein N'